MSSVTRFIRQIPVSTTYYDAAGVITNASSSAGNNLYTFTADEGNYVGNYTPGYMTAGNAQLVAQIAAAAAKATSTSSTLVLRDMGKTLFARVGVSGTNKGYFRQVQLINPTAITSTNILGGTTGTNFGVLGAPGVPAPGDDYFSFYIPVTVAGVSVASANLAAYAVAGGQM
jgi:hypothetical protein